MKIECENIRWWTWLWLWLVPTVKITVDKVTHHYKYWNGKSYLVKEVGMAFIVTKEENRYSDKEVVRVLQAMLTKLTEVVNNGRIEVPRCMYHFCEFIAEADEELDEMLELVRKEERRVKDYAKKL